MSRIQINLSTQSIDRAIKALKTYRADLDKGLENLVQSLAEEGADVARSAYAAAPVSDGNSDTSVSVKNTGKYSRQIVAQGESVGFLEFGTGVTAGSGYDGNTAGVPVYPGAWAESHAKKFSRDGYWYYGGKRFTGTLPYKGMYSATKAIRERVADMAKGIIKE